MYSTLLIYEKAENKKQAKENFLKSSFGKSYSNLRLIFVPSEHTCPFDGGKLFEVRYFDYSNIL